MGCDFPSSKAVVFQESNFRKARPADSMSSTRGRCRREVPIASRECTSYGKVMYLGSRVPAFCTKYYSR